MIQIDQCSVVKADSLSEIAEDRTKKSKLWKVLQLLFP